LFSFFMLFLLKDKLYLFSKIFNVSIKTQSEKSFGRKVLSKYSLILSFVKSSFLCNFKSISTISLALWETSLFSTKSIFLASKYSAVNSLSKNIFSAFSIAFFKSSSSTGIIFSNLKFTFIYLVI